VNVVRQHAQKSGRYIPLLFSYVGKDKKKWNNFQGKGQKIVFLFLVFIGKML